jgi:LacI family transcriptional regulator
MKKGSETDPPLGEDGRPTLKTIAFMAGLGVTTVSRALKDASDIGMETKRRVRLIADQVGYRPNRAGVRLRTGKTNLISLLLETSETVLGFMPAMIYGVSDRLAGTPYHLVITPRPAEQDPLGPVRYVVETGAADGVLISRIMPHDPRVLYLLEKHMPFATHGRTLIDHPHPFHDFDNHAYGMQAVAALHARGRKRIAVITPPPELTFYRHMTAGVSDAVRLYGLTEIPLRGIDLDSPAEAVRAVMEALVHAGPDWPDGVIASSGSSGIAVTRGYEEAGLKHGQDFDVVAKETSPMQQWYRPGIIVIPEDFRAAGWHLADALLGAIDGKDIDLLQTVAQPGA